MNREDSPSPSSSSFSATSMQSKQDRLAQLQHEQRRLERQLQVQEFAAGYEVQVAWPASVRGNRRTDPDLIQHRLLEAGMLYEVPTSLKDVTDAATRFVAGAVLQVGSGGIRGQGRKWR
jgi:hypothetical protein